MNGQKQRQTSQRRKAVSVGGMDKKLIDQLRAEARAHHRSLAGHIRAILEQAVMEAAR